MAMLGYLTSAMATLLILRSLTCTIRGATRAPLIVSTGRTEPDSRTEAGALVNAVRPWLVQRIDFAK